MIVETMSVASAVILRTVIFEATAYLGYRFERRALPVETVVDFGSMGLCSLMYYDALAPSKVP